MNADQNDCCSDFSYLFPCTAPFKIKLRQTELRFIRSSILCNSMKIIQYWYDPIRKGFFVRLLVYALIAVIDWLIKWVQSAPAVDHSPVLKGPCLRAWTQLTYFLSFFISSVFPLHFAMSRIFCVIQCPKSQGEGLINFPWPSYFLPPPPDILWSVRVDVFYHWI